MKHGKRTTLIIEKKRPEKRQVANGSQWEEAFFSLFFEDSFRVVFVSKYAQRHS
jgi:hypothetical protein